MAVAGCCCYIQLDRVSPDTRAVTETPKTIQHRGASRFGVNGETCRLTSKMP
jgi:hypothetical protein